MYHIVLGDPYYFVSLLSNFNEAQAHFFPYSWFIKHICEVQTFPKFLHAEHMQWSDVGSALF